MQLFEDRDNPTSNVFIEVFEGFIDASFTKTAKFVHCNLGLRLGVSQKPMFFKRIKQLRVERRDSSQFQPVAPRFGIAKDEGLFLRQAEYPWQLRRCRTLGRALQRLHISWTC